MAVLLTGFGKSLLVQLIPGKREKNGRVKSCGRVDCEQSLSFPTRGLAGEKQATKISRGHFFLRFFRVTHEGLSKRGTTRSLLIAACFSFSRLEEMKL